MLSSDFLLPPSSFLLGLAALGHLVLMVGSHNWWYGQPLGKRLGDALHLLHGALVVAFPLALYLAWGWRLEGLFELSSAPPGQLLVAAYVGVCLLAAGVLLPGVTARRLLRREPVLVAHSQVVDLAAARGRPPA